MKDVGKALMDDPEVWRKRPLSAELLEYAAFDVTHIFRLRSRGLGPPAAPAR